MEVSATEVQNNFGRYLRLCRSENIIITRNGKRQALLLPIPEDFHDMDAAEPESIYGTSPRKENFVTYREFLELCEKSENRYELIDGEVYLLGAPNFRHQKILGDLYILFHEYLKRSESCDVFLSPFNIRLFRQPLKMVRDLTEDDTNVVQPDLIVLCDYRKDLDEKDQYWGTPSLAVEILSPSTRSKDMTKKLDLYRDSGMEEFWMVDPNNRAVTIYLFKDFLLEEHVIFTGEQRAVSFRFPGLEAGLKDLFV